MTLGDMSLSFSPHLLPLIMHLAIWTFFLFITYAELIPTSRPCYVLSYNVILQINTWLLWSMQGSADIQADLWWSNLKRPHNLRDPWISYSALFFSEGLSSTEMIFFIVCLWLVSPRKASAEIFIGLRITNILISE